MAVNVQAHEVATGPAGEDAEAVGGAEVLGLQAGEVPPRVMRPLLARLKPADGKATLAILGGPAHDAIGQGHVSY